MPITHEHMFTIVKRLPSDYTDYGGEVVRWADEDNHGYADCSCDCRWAAWLEGSLGGDWCVCTKPNAPRAGLVTFEHQAGYECFENNPEPDKSHQGDTKVL